MERLHARYPFLDASRAAVEAADVDLGDVVAAGGPAVERGRNRLEAALLEGTVGEEAATVRTELLSYPIARVLVSLLDVPGAIEKYTAAEAASARERFERDFRREMELKSERGTRLSIEELLADFGLSGRVEPTGEGGFGVDVTAYLELASALEGDEWRLVARPLDGGRVPTERRELYTLLREAVDRRVREGLPLSVPDPIAESLQPELDVLRSVVADLDPPTSFEAAVPGLFPPCMRTLLRRVRAGEPLDAHSRFSLVSFLACAGLDAEEVVTLCDLSGKSATSVREQLELLRDDRGAVTAPPSCAVVVEYGDCVVETGEVDDDLCGAIEHPLSYYERKLETAPAEAIVDWRDSGDSRRES